MSSTTPSRPRRAPHELWRGIRQNLRSDVLGGALLLAATVAALVLANSPLAPWYEQVRDFRFGIPELHLELSVGAWAADGLLAIFFFVVGLELKEEFVTGRLRDPRRAALPIAAAAGGVVAWLVGLLLGQVWGPAPDPVLGPDYGFTLRSYAVLLLWPGALAFITLVLSLFGVLSKKPVK